MGTFLDQLMFARACWAIAGRKQSPSHIDGRCRVLRARRLPPPAWCTIGFFYATRARGAVRQCTRRPRRTTHRKRQHLQPQRQTNCRTPARQFASAAATSASPGRQELYFAKSVYPPSSPPSIPPEIVCPFFASTLTLSTYVSCCQSTPVGRNNTATPN